MMIETETAAAAAAKRDKNLVALTSVLAAIFLTGMKFVVGLATGSLGILSEAAHSLLDLVAAAITLIAVRMSGKPADSDHPYGHGKFENISALFETLLLLITCIWIIYEGIKRLFFEEVPVEASTWGFVVMVVSIVVDVSRSRALYRIAQKYKSQALEADALHFSTDVWSSSVVIGGLVAVSLSEKLGIPLLEKADAVAALGVAGIVVYVSLKLGGKTVSALTDAAPGTLGEEIRGCVEGVSGVEQVERVRVRQSGPEIFADVIIKVDQDSPLEKVSSISARTREAILEAHPGADIVVEVTPSELDEKKLLSTVRLVAARHDLGAHGIQILEEEGMKHLELHLEVDEKLTVEAAHEQVNTFEKDLQKVLPFIASVVSHIEPIGELSVERQTQPVTEHRALEVIAGLKYELGTDIHPHLIRLYHVDHEVSLSFHCVVDPETAITQAHDLTIKIEQLLRAKLPHLGRIVIHVETPTAALSCQEEAKH